MTHITLQRLTLDKFKGIDRLEMEFGGRACPFTATTPAARPPYTMPTCGCSPDGTAWAGLILRLSLWTTWGGSSTTPPGQRSRQC